MLLVADGVRQAVRLETKDPVRPHHSEGQRRTRDRGKRQTSLSRSQSEARAKPLRRKVDVEILPPQLLRRSSARRAAKPPIRRLRDACRSEWTMGRSDPGGE